MNTINQSRYYVYGLAVNNAEFFHFGVTNKKPEANKHEIYSGFSEHEARRPKDLKMELKSVAELDLFELEDFSSLDAANEAVEYWFNCFRSYGLGILKSQT